MVACAREMVPCALDIAACVLEIVACVLEMAVCVLEIVACALEVVASLPNLVPIAPKVVAIALEDVPCTRKIVTIASWVEAIMSDGWSCNAQRTACASERKEPHDRSPAVPLDGRARRGRALRMSPFPPLSRLTE